MRPKKKKITSEDIEEIIVKIDFYSEEHGTIVLSDEEIYDICVIEKLCYEEGLEYDERNVRYILAEPGAVLVRFFDGDKLIALQMSNVKKRLLITIDVHPDYRNIGLGRKMLETTLDELKKLGVPKVYCQISTTNTASLMLHKKLKFNIKKVIPNYYGNGMHAYWFVKIL